MPISTKGKFVLGAAVTGAYTGDIIDDPVAGIFGALVLAGTASAMKLVTSDVVGNSKVMNTFNIDQNKINITRQTGYTEADLATLAKTKNKLNKINAHFKNIADLRTQLEDVTLKLQDPNLEPGVRKRLIRTGKTLNRKLAKVGNQSAEGFAQNIAEKLKVTNTTINPTQQGLIDYVNAISEPSKANAVLAMLEGASPVQQQSIKKSVMPTKNTKAVFSLSRKSTPASLTKYLMTNLGNTQADAELKTKLVLERAVGDTITIQNHNMMFTDKVTGKTQVLPLTAETKKGIMSHSPSAGTYFAVAGVNPYAAAYSTGQTVKMLDGTTRVPTFQDATKRMHPELLALQLYQGKSLDDGISFVKAQMKFSGDESQNELIHRATKLNDTDLTKRFRSTGSALNIEHTVNYDNLGNLVEDKPLRKIAKVSSQGGTSSELKAAMMAYQQGFIDNAGAAESMFNNVSINNLTTISGTVFNPLAPMSMNQRGATAVGIRDTVPVNRSSAYKTLAGSVKSFEQQFESSNVFDKIDILDKKAFNEAVAHLYGSDKVLADGAGLFNLNASSMFEHGLNQRIVISPQKSGNLFIKNSRINELLQAHQELLESKSKVLKNGNGVIDEDFIDLYQKAKGLRSLDAARMKKGEASLIPDDVKTVAQLMDHVGTKAYLPVGFPHEDLDRYVGKFKIKPEQVLAYNGDGSAVKLHKQFSEGVLKGLMMDEAGQLILHTNSTFNPGKEKIVKLFSEASKSNLFGVSNYKQIAALGALTNAGQITIKDGLPYYKGDMSAPITTDFLDKHVNLIEDKVAKNVQLSPLEIATKNAMSTQVLLAAEDTNISDFIKMTNASTRDEVMDTLKKGSKVKLSDNSLQMVQNALHKNSSLNDTKRAALAAYMTANFKGATDITGTAVGNIMENFQAVVENRSTKAQEQAISNLFSMFSGDKPTIDGVRTDAEMRNKTHAKLTKLIASSTNLKNLTEEDPKKRQTAFNRLVKLLSGVSDDDLQRYSSGTTNTIASLNKGQGVLGVGNEARLSWTAQHQLLQSGFTKEQLSVFGHSDPQALLELESLFGERNSGFGRRHAKTTINKYLTQDNLSDFERTLARTIPEGRLDALKKLGIEVSDKTPFITYELKNNYKGLERLNFSTVSTNRSGFFTKDDQLLLKQLEGHRLNLFRLDRQLANAKGDKIPQARKAFEEAADEYIKISESTLRGDNSLVKNAASLRSKQSNVGLARAIGGEASAYIQNQVDDGKMPNGVFVSEEGLDMRLKRMNIGDKEWRYSPIDGYSDLNKVQYKVNNEWIDLKGLYTREPSQGNLSSTWEDIIVDRSIKDVESAEHTYVPENHIAFTTGKVMDYDQDQLQELFPKLSSKAQQVELDTKFNKIGEDVNRIARLHKFLKVKGADKATPTAMDFDNYEDAVSYKNVAGLQGRERKALAPPSTSLAVDITEALSLEFGKDSQRTHNARFLTHTLVENLIKSAHVDTKDYEKQTESSIEAFSRLRKDYIGGRIDAKTYRKEITPIIDQSLNLGKALASTDLSQEDKDFLSAARDDMVTAEVNQAKTVASRAKHPLHVTQGVGGGNIMTRATDALENFVLGTGSEFDLQGTQSYGRMLTETKTNIAKTISQNKGIIGLGLGALTVGSMMTRSGPDLPDIDKVDTDRYIRNDPSKNLRPARTVPTGIDTNKQTSNYIVPKQHTKARSIEIDGDYTDLLVPPEDRIRDMSSAVFGDALRQVRIET